MNVPDLVSCACTFGGLCDSARIRLDLTVVPTDSDDGPNDEWAIIADDGQLYIECKMGIVALRKWMDQRAITGKVFEFGDFVDNEQKPYTSLYHSFSNFIHNVIVNSGGVKASWLTCACAYEVLTGRQVY